MIQNLIKRLLKPNHIKLNKKIIYKKYHIKYPKNVYNYTETEKTYLKSKDIYKYFLKNDIDFYTGVPDSLLKDYLTYIDKKGNNIVTANEGLAVSFAVGYNLATNKIPCVYLQNSGLGNIINPLISLTNEKVYNIIFTIEVFKGTKPRIK